MQQNYVNTKTKQHPVKQIIHNFSLYVLSGDKEIALSYRLDQHVPSNLNKTDIEAEFKQFYHGLLKDISNIPEENLSTLKTKLRSTCEKYTRIIIPYKYQQTVKKLSKNQSIVIMKQEKDRGVVIMDKSKMILENDNFKTLDRDPTKKPEEKIQRILWKMKNRLSPQEYLRLYPSGSCPGKFYGTAKVHKISENDTVDELPIRPIVSNIGTATYNLSKYLAKLLSPLSQSEYTIKNTKQFIEQIRMKQVPDGYKMVSFDVKSLFTNVPLEKTIEITLKRIYERKEINTSISKKEMKQLLTLCTKNVHFTYDNKVYQQNDGVAMGSPLGPVLSGIFMVELENRLVLTLNDSMTLWRRFADDAITFVKNDSIAYILDQLNSFHK